MKTKQEKTTVLEIEPIGIGQALFTVIGVQPLIYNSMSVKAQRELLLPARKTKADRVKTLKQDPLSEYRASTYRSSKGPTALVLPAPMFKRAIAEASVDIGGASKAQLGRLCWVAGYSINLYGVPQMMISVMRDAGMSKTPRIRTRAVVPQWTASFLVEFIKPNLTENSIATILSGAGMICGVGDSRPQKGRGNFGQFRLATASDASFVADLTANGAREAQERALAEPEFFDDETEELYRWFVEEIEKRGQGDMLDTAGDEFEDTELEEAAE